jgi:hypothetical protein
MTDISKLNIDEFCVSDMVDDPTIAMIAKRGAGKSWITKDLIFEKSDIPVGIIISGSEECNPFYSDFFPSTYIHYKFNSNILEKLLYRQTKIIKKAKKKKEDGKYLDPRALLIMDDCLADKKTWANDTNLIDIFLNGRHRRITYILTMQFPLGISPQLRSNFDYIFLLKEDQLSNIKRIFEHWAPITDKLKDFRDIFAQLTQDHGAMVYLNGRAAKDDKLTDKIKWYKARDLTGKKIKFGCKQFRKYHEKNYDAEWNDKLDNLKYQHIENSVVGNYKKKFNVKKV